jgi:large subunit ribosomal protein L28
MWFCYVMDALDLRPGGDASLGLEGACSYTENSASLQGAHRVASRRFRPERGQEATRGGAKHRQIWSRAMAQVCDVCGKGPQFGNNISHAHNVTRRRWNVNLQAVKALVNGAPKRIRVCTSCIKAGKIAKA